MLHPRKQQPETGMWLSKSEILISETATQDRKSIDNSGVYDQGQLDKSVSKQL